MIDSDPEPPGGTFSSGYSPSREEPAPERASPLAVPYGSSSNREVCLLAHTGSCLASFSHTTQNHLPWEWCCPRWAKPSYKNGQPRQSLGPHTPRWFRKLLRWTAKPTRTPSKRQTLGLLSLILFQKYCLLRFSTPWKRLSVHCPFCWWYFSTSVVAVSVLVLGMEPRALNSISTLPLSHAPIAWCFQTASWYIVQDGLELTIVLPLPPPE